MPVITLDRVSIAFGHLPLVDEASLQIDDGERIAIIGRNGAGKSTLLQMLSGERPPDAGSVWRAPGLRIARLAQDVPPGVADTVFDLVAEGLDDLRDLVREYHHAAVDVAADPTPARLAALGRLQHTLDERDGWRVEQRVENVIARLGLDPDVRVDALSGGWRRRALLARALVAEPTLLLLDEPTNHLDIDAIEWLETLLADYRGAVVFVTHDRAFLERLATRIVELDRGQLRSWPGGYRSFLEKKEAWLENETLAQQKFDTLLSREEAWLRRGIKARRTRDEGRVRALMKMREERAARRTQTGSVRAEIDASSRSGRLVFEVDRVTKSYDHRTVVRDFSTRIMRGDRIGLIGPNGTGKTTLLRLLAGELVPDTGEVRRGANVQIAYFDQQREQLDPERTVADTVADGNDTVTIGGTSRHVHGYLEDFLFAPERARSLVKSLSGGERNRLLLARLLARPANVLMLDEPTNDLDIETLEVLEATLVDFPGTILVVSHDRRFLDNLVTSTLAFDGSGHIDENVGGYADWQRRHLARAVLEGPAPPGSAEHPSPPAAAVAVPKKLSYKERLEFDALPGKIDGLETEIARLEAAVAGPEFYKEPADQIRATLATLETARADLETAYARWDELDSRSSRP